jgi:trehalose/maltose hydrolase-like predicted phosphorylase
VQRASRVGELLQSHLLAWGRLWSEGDIALEDGRRTQLLVRLHLFHLLQTVSPHTIDLDVGVPSRGWHVEAYRGHILWDELFIFPTLNLLFPELTRALLSDIQGGTTPEGIHLGAMTGTVDLVQRCYTGIEMRDKVLWLNPRLREDLRRLTLHMRYRSHELTLDVTYDTLQIAFRQG